MNPILTEEVVKSRTSRTRKILLGLSVIAVLAVAIAAYAADYRPNGSEHFDKSRSFGASIMGGPMYGLALKLELTDEQRETIRNIVEDSRQQSQGARDQLFALRQQIAEAIRSNGYNEEQVRSIVTSNYDVVVGMIVLRAQTKAAIYESLTTEQKAKAEAFFENGESHQWRSRKPF